MGASEMTPAEQFAAWLKQAMRGAGYDIDSQRGGGRNELAARMNIAKSTVTRWLSGEVLPAAEYFPALAEALDVSVIDALVGAGIISRASAAALQRDPVKILPVTPEQAADALGITAPMDRELFLAMAENLRKRADNERSKDS